MTELAGERPQDMEEGGGPSEQGRRGDIGASGVASAPAQATTGPSRDATVPEAAAGSTGSIPGYARMPDTVPSTGGTGTRDEASPAFRGGIGGQESDEESDR